MKAAPNAGQRKSVEIGPLSTMFPGPLTFICGLRSFAAEISVKILLDQCYR